MTATTSPETLDADDRPPGIVLSKTAFTITLLLVASLPIVIVGILWFAMPVNPYPPADVTLELALPAGATDPETGRPAAFPLYRITNVGRRDLYRVAVYAKDVFGNRFEFNFNESLPAGETLTLNSGDLAMRTAHTLQEGAQLESMEVSARLPSGARALSKWTMEGNQPRLVEDKTVRTYVQDERTEAAP
ncbi:MAG TPA: hypothetical protein VGN57_22070 [Pirellulaceae bacterium]|nr:hypothetical protein [Pirellulaceae bacterium]